MQSSQPVLSPFPKQRPMRLHERASRRKTSMSLNDPEPPARRLFLRQIGGASGAAALAAPALLGGLASPFASAQDAAARAADNAHPSGYLSLGPQEAACVEALVNVMCPADAMTPNVVSVTPDTTLDECCKVMEDHQIRRVLVVDDKGACCGIIAQADIAASAPPAEVAEVVQEVSRATAS